MPEISWPDGFPHTLEERRRVCEQKGELRDGVTSLFYSQLGPGQVQTKILKWYQTNLMPILWQDPFGVNVRKPTPATTCSSAAGWGSKGEQHLTTGWASKTRLIRGPNGLPLNLSQTLGARTSLVYAEQTKGPLVFFFAGFEHDGANMGPNTSWARFEFPVLTRNPTIEKIIQVDMRLPVSDPETGALNTRVIWEKHEGPQREPGDGHEYAFGDWVTRCYAPCHEVEDLLKVARGLEMDFEKAAMPPVSSTRAQGIEIDCKKVSMIPIPSTKAQWVAMNCEKVPMPSTPPTKAQGMEMDCKKASVLPIPSTEDRGITTDCERVPMPTIPSTRASGMPMDCEKVSMLPIPSTRARLKRGLAKRFRLFGGKATPV